MYLTYLISFKFLIREISILKHRFLLQRKKSKRGLFKFQVEIGGQCIFVSQLRKSNAKNQHTKLQLVQIACEIPAFKYIYPMIPILSFLNKGFKDHKK